MFTVRSIIAVAGGMTDFFKIKSIIASVYNRDLKDEDEPLEIHEAVVAAAACILLEMDYKSGYVQAIFRFLREDITPAFLFGVPAILSIADNRYVKLIGKKWMPTYDFIKGQRLAEPAPAPLIGMSINLIKLRQLLATSQENPDSH